MSTRADLRRRVFGRADPRRDWLTPLEADQLLDDGQDRFTERSEILRRDLVVALTSGTSSYQMTSTGRIGRIVSAQINDGTYDQYPLYVVASSDLASSVPTWRTDDGVPTHLFRGFDPGQQEAARLPTQDRIWLYPTINASGYLVRIQYVYYTLRQLADDETQPLVGAFWEEAIVDYAAAEAMLRRATDVERVPSEASERLLAASQVYRDRFELKVEEALATASGHFGASLRVGVRRF